MIIMVPEALTSRFLKGYSNCVLIKFSVITHTHTHTLTHTHSHTRTHTHTHTHTHTLTHTHSHTRTHTQATRTNLLPARLAPSSNAPTVEDVYQTTTGAAHDYKPTDPTLQQPKAPGSWKVHYTLDTIRRVRPHNPMDPFPVGVKSEH